MAKKTSVAGKDSKGNKGKWNTRSNGKKVFVAAKKKAAPKQDIGTAESISSKDKYSGMPFGEQVSADVKLKYADQEQSLLRDLGQTQQHQSTIDTVFQGYRDDLLKNQAAVAAANKAAQDAVSQATAQSSMALGAEAAPQNAEVAAQVGAAQQGAVADATTGQSVLAAQGLANEGGLARIGAVTGGLQQQISNDRLGRENQLKDSQRALSEEKDAYATSRSGELSSAAAEQELAARTLLADDQDSLRDYQIAMDKLKLDETTLTVNDENEDADRSANTARWDADRATDMQIAKLKSETSKKIQSMKDKTSLEKLKVGGTGGATGGAFRSYDGTGIELTAAEQKAWQQQKNGYTAMLQDAANAQTESAQAFNKGGKTREEKAMGHLKASYSGVPTQVLRAAIYASTHDGKVDGRYAKILASYFKGGLVPADMVAGG